MGEIKLIDSWVVVVDDLNYSLAKKVPTKQKDDGKERPEFTYKYVGYYGSLTSAMKALCDMITRDELQSRESMDFAEAAKIINDSYERVSDLLEEVLSGR